MNKLIQQKKKELKPRVHCKCGKLGVDWYDGELQCSEIIEITKSGKIVKMNLKKYDKFDNQHEVSGNWADLSVWNFIEELTKLK